MVTIPKQLQKPEFRFVKVWKAHKNPIELEWTTKNNYPYDNPIMQQWLADGQNYGIVCGYGKLRVIDVDTKNIEHKTLIKEIESKTDTFSIKTGSGGRHFYFITDYDSNPKMSNGFGEIQCVARQIIGPGSLHPEGTYYQIINDKPIQKISTEEFQALFQNYINIPNSTTEHKQRDNSRSGKEFRDIIRLIQKGWPKEEIYERMMAYSKWTENNSGYRDYTYANAVAYVEGQRELRRREKEDYVNSAPTELIKNIRNYFIKEDFMKMAEEFIKHQPLFYDKNQLWWVWDHGSHCYKIIDDTDMLNYVQEALDNDKVLFSKYKNVIITALQMVGRKNIPEPIDKTWIQFQNKIIDIMTGEEIDVSPIYFAVNPIPLDLGDSDETPTIDGLFKSWVGEEYVKTLHEIIGYCLLPDYPFHRIFCLTGSGSNGKSRFIELIKRFIGGNNTCSTDLDILLDNRFETAKLYKKLVCFMAETNFNVMNKTSRLKMLTGGDLIGFEFKNKQPFDDINYAKMLISTNSIPVTADKSDGFYRRWLIIDFPNKFLQESDILATIPNVEYNNLCRKALNNLRNVLVRHSFTNDGSIEEKKKRFEEHSNPITKFVEDCCDIDSDGFVSKTTFSKELYKWLKQSGYRSLTDIEIGKIMRLSYDEAKKSFQKKNEAGIWEEHKYWAWTGLNWKGWKKSVPEVGEIKKGEYHHKCIRCKDTNKLCIDHKGLMYCPECYNDVITEKV
jgi:P4 family phage/plasmid primase-like protien